MTCIVLLTASLSACTPAPVALDRSARYAVSATPAGLVAKDLDGDGDVDLAVVHRVTDELSVFRNDGHGGFEDRYTRRLVDAPVGLAASDLTGEGDRELIIGRTGVQGAPPEERFVQLSVSIGQGDGNFGPTSTNFLWSSPDDEDGRNEPAAADLDGDGNRDVVMATDFGDDDVVVLHGTGDTFFTAPRSLNLFTNGASDVTVGHYDDDPYADFAVTSRGDGRVIVGWGAPPNQFRPISTYNVGVGSGSIASGDVNGDHHTDLVIGNDTGGSAPDARVLLNNGNGGFRTPAMPVRVGQQGAGGVVEVAIADLNGDRLKDVVLAGNGERPLWVVPSAGNGEFGPGLPFGRRSTLGPPLSVAVGDVDADGRPDVVLASNGPDGGVVTTWRNRST